MFLSILKQCTIHKCQCNTVKTNNMLKIHLAASSGDLELVLKNEIDYDGIGLTKSAGGCLISKQQNTLMVLI